MSLDELQHLDYEPGSEDAVGWFSWFSNWCS